MAYKRSTLVPPSIMLVESAIEGMKGGAFDYLMKPCDIDLLMAKIDRAVGRKREHEEKILQAKAQMIALRKGY